MSLIAVPLNGAAQTPETPKQARPRPATAARMAMRILFSFFRCRLRLLSPPRKSYQGEIHRSMINSSADVRLDLSNHTPPNPRCRPDASALLREPKTFSTPLHINLIKGPPVKRASSRRQTCVGAMSCRDKAAIFGLRERDCGRNCSPRLSEYQYAKYSMRRSQDCTAMRRH